MDSSGATLATLAIFFTQCEKGQASPFLHLPCAKKLQGGLDTCAKGQASPFLHLPCAKKLQGFTTVLTTALGSACAEDPPPPAMAAALEGVLVVMEDALTRDIMFTKVASVCLSSSISWRICVRSR